MGCFLGCFGGDKDRKRRKTRVNRASPQRQRNRAQSVQQESLITAEKFTAETAPSTDLVSELRNKPEVEEKLSPSPRKRVTFNSNVTTHELVPVHESVDSLPEIPIDPDNEKEEHSKASSQSHSISEDDNSVISSVGSYPPNHRYHNARDSDDEAEDYGDSDLDDLEDEDEDDDDYDDYDDEDIDVRIAAQEVWSESVLTPSLESRTGNPSEKAFDEEVESPIVKTQSSDEKGTAFGPKTNTRDRSDYVNSVLNPVENITQWKAVKSKRTHSVKLHKENCSEPTLEHFKSRSDQPKNENREISVDASLSNWLGSPEATSSKKTSFSGLETATSGQTMSEGGYTSVKSFEDRPILGALTVEELKQISASASPRKSPSRSPDDMPIIGTVGTYWSHSASTKRSDSVSSFKGIPNTTSKYREDKKVNWHSTPFEKRLDRALKRGAAEA